MLEVVVFLYKSSREADFLENFFKGFEGVSVSDFYAGYDALDCPQQKCLIHLIRDLNEDLFKTPFDNEFKKFVEKFAILLRKVISTVDRYGLKKRHLHKHNKDVLMFFKVISRRKYSSALADKYQKQFEKSKNKLFTFLNYDGVPWNNNNAEHALKHFTIYRKIVDGMFEKSGIEDYLVILSIYQTCRYRNINFLQFLLSQKKHCLFSRPQLNFNRKIIFTNLRKSVIINLHYEKETFVL